jgi:hypothetical protein
MSKAMVKFPLLARERTVHARSVCAFALANAGNETNATAAAHLPERSRSRHHDPRSPGASDRPGNDRGSR